MVGVAQLVRASGCGPEGRRFKSVHSPQFSVSNYRASQECWGAFFVGSDILTILILLGVLQAE